MTYVKSAMAGSGQSTTTGSTTATITIPVEGAVGDVAVMTTHDDTTANTLATSGTGWTVLSGGDPVSAQGITYVLGKTLVSGDPGSVVTLTFSPNNTRRVAQMQVHRGVTLTGYQIARKAEGGTSAPAFPTLPGVPAGATLIGWLDRRKGGGAAPTVTTDPAGYSKPATNGTPATAFASGDNVASFAYYKTTTAGGTVGGEGAILSTSGVGNNYLLALAPGTTTNPPTVNAGPDQTGIEPWTTVLLDATDATDNTVVTRTWTQTSGTTVTLAGGSDATQATFTAPGTLAGATLVFTYTATDSYGATASDTVSITVYPAAERLLLSGVWTPSHPPTVVFATPGGGGTGGVSTPPAMGLSAVADPGFLPPRVRIDLESTTLTTVTVSRQDPDGHVVPVRTADGGPVTLSGGSATLFDYEAPYQGTLTYLTDISGGATDTTQLDVTDVWLIHPGVPTRSVKLKITKLAQRARATARTLYQILASGFPVAVSSGARPAAAATLGVRTYTDAQRQALDLLLDDDDVLLLNIPPSKGYGWTACYVSCGDLTEDRTVPNYGPMPLREWTLPIQVVGRPGGGNQAAITWDTVAAQYATWQAIIDAGVTSWAELTAPTT